MLSFWPERWRRAAGILSMALAIGSCRDPARPMPPDLTAPTVSVVFPMQATGAFDRDSNGLVDVEVTWSDAYGRVNPSSVRITCVGCVPGVAADTNLASGWRVVRLDSAGAAFEETIPLLMRTGRRLLGVSVADSAGNRSVGATVSFNLPPGAYHRSIDLLYPPEWPQERGGELAITPDGRKGFAPFLGGNVAVFDPDGVVPTHYIRNVPNSFFGSSISIDSGTGLAYIAGGGGATTGFSILDTRTEQLVRSVAVGAGAASVWVGGGRIFVGEACTTGRVYVFDKVSLAQVGVVEVGAAIWNYTCVNSITFALSADGRSGWGGMVDGDLYAFNAADYSLIRRFDLYPPEGDGIWTMVQDMELVGDRWLYLARLGEGLDEFDTQTGRVTSHYPFAPPPYPMVQFLALSPDRRLMFASSDPGTAPGTWPNAPLLFTVPGLRLKYQFPTRPGHVEGVAFHPDGKRVYQMAQFAMQVYLIRPD